MVSFFLLHMNFFLPVKAEALFADSKTFKHSVSGDCVADCIIPSIAPVHSFYSEIDIFCGFVCWFFSFPGQRIFLDILYFLLVVRNL